MGGPYQFEDLPQIHMPDDSSFPVWPNDYVGHMNLPRLDRSRTITLNGETMDFDGMRDYSRSAMQPMQRFLKGVDRAPFVTGFINSKLEYTMPQSGQYFGQYDQPWPALDFMAYSPRDGSPDRTSSSDNSSYSANNELRSPRLVHNMPCRSPDSPFSPYSNDIQADALSPYPAGTLQAGGAYSSNLTTAGIDPRNLEYEHVPEPVVEEHDHGDMKPDYEYEHDQVYQAHDQRVDSVSEVYQTPYSDPGRARDPESVQPIGAEDSDDSDYKPSTNKNNKKRRPSASSSGSGRPRRRSNARKLSNTSAATKVGKRTRGSNASASAAKGAAAKADGGDERPFPCPLAQYGCQSIFQSKNEWKRHVFTQHIKLGFWRCDLCATATDPADDRTVYHNDFNRKDLFCQHLRRMHAAPKTGTYTSSKQLKPYPVTEDNLVEHTQRCYQVLRPAPQQSSCLFCNHNFKGPQSFEERMEHVGRHLEKERKTSVVPTDPAEWRHDPALEQYLFEEGLITQDRNGWKIGDGKPRRLHEGYDEDDSEADD